MTVLFDGEIWVHYGYLFLQPPDEPPDLIESRGGQANGLCGAAQPGRLAMVTGLHTGLVPVRVELLDSVPALEPDWDEAVEASFDTAQPTLALAAFQDSEAVTLPPGRYRVRWCASGMDAARAQDVRMEDEPAPDRYRLQLWPAPAAPDAILRQTSEIAAYWHGVARETPPPPPPPTALEALDHGRELPAPFDDPARAWAAMYPPETTVMVTRISISSGPPAPEAQPTLSPGAAAIDTVLSAGAADPAGAALDALGAASSAEPDLAAFCAEVRRTWLR